MTFRHPLLFIVTSLFISLVAVAQGTQKHPSILIILSQSDSEQKQRAESIIEALRNESDVATVSTLDVESVRKGFFGNVRQIAVDLLRKHFPQDFSHYAPYDQETIAMIPRLSSLSSKYSLEDLLATIKSRDVTSVVTTDAQIAKSLGDLRDQGELRNIKILWASSDREQTNELRFSMRLDRLEQFNKDSQDVAVEHVADFALRGGLPEHLSERLDSMGKLRGQTPTNTTAVLEELEKNAPADIEIVMGYPTAKVSYYLATITPFGHIGIRVRNKMYSINYMAKAGQDKNLVVETTLENYLYGVIPHTINEDHSSTFGETYARDVIALRVSGLSNQQLDAMEAIIQGIQTRWELKKAKYKLFGFNCATLVRILIEEAGGYKFTKKTSVLGVDFPLDVFDGALETLSAQPNLDVNLVGYNYVQDSKNPWKPIRFPLSLLQIRRSLRNLFFKSPDPLEKDLHYRVASYAARSDVVLEDLTSEASRKARWCAGSLENL